MADVQPFQLVAVDPRDDGNARPIGAEGRDLINICVGVIRYYGGINLGTGGLARAYGGTAKMAMEAARVGPYVEMQQIRLVVDYARFEPLSRDIGKIAGQVLDKQFGERVSVIALVPVSEPFVAVATT